MPAKEVVVHVDVVTEQAIIAAAIVDDAVRAALLKRFPPEAFQDETHRAGWRALHDLQRRGLAFDSPTFHQLLGDAARFAYFSELVEIHGPDAPPAANLEFLTDALSWDRQRVAAASGPVASLLEALHDPKSAPERVRALARHVGEAFDGGAGAGRWLHDRAELVRSQVEDLRVRVAGRATYPYGIEGLDEYEDGATDDRTGGDIGGTRRMIPGAAPGMITLLAGHSGSGKSTLAGHMALGLARQRRRGLYCAWEPQSGMTLELLACLSLGWSRTALIQGKDQRSPRAPMPHEQVVEVEERMHAIGKYVAFMSNPFRRARAERATNATNLDVFQEHLAAVPGASWAICDLWDRCLEDTRPDEEKRALFRQQAMALEQGVHVVLLAQQRKDVEGRQDKRPTREGITGSGAWTQVADTILAPYRPGQWKSVLDDKIEINVLKQRWGRWPLCISYDWDGDKGSLANARSVAYEHPSEGGVGGVEDVFQAPEAGKKKRWGGR